MAWTEVREVINNQGAGYLMVNLENHGDDLASCTAGTQAMAIRVSQSRQTPLCISSKKGIYQIWDSDWVVWYSLNCGPDETLIPKGQGAGGTIKLELAADGTLGGQKYP